MHVTFFVNKPKMVAMETETVKSEFSNNSNTINATHNETSQLHKQPLLFYGNPKIWIIRSLACFW